MSAENIEALWNIALFALAVFVPCLIYAKLKKKEQPFRYAGIRTAIGVGALFVMGTVWFVLA